MSFRLIAEVGVNHLGSVKLAKEMVDAGHSAGVKLFKFQIFTVEELGETENWDWYPYMNHCALSKEQHFEIKDYCDKKGLTYFASVFGDWSFEVAEEMGMPLYKIASRSVYDEKGNISELANKIYSTGKPTISSLGYRQEFWPFPVEDNNENLYCVSKYPTIRADITWPDFNNVVSFVEAGGKRYSPSTDQKDDDSRVFTCLDPNDFTLNQIEGVLRSFKPFSGFSDHTIGTSITKEAIDLGATVIEKHFTIDKTLFGPDQVGSALPSEMKEIQDYGNNYIDASSK